MIRSIGRVLTATLMATVLCLLVLPPDLALAAMNPPKLGPVDGPVASPASPRGDVGFLPSQYDFVFSLPDSGVELRVARVESGYLFWPTEDPSRWGFVSDEQVERISFESSESSESGAEGISGRLTFEDALGAPVDYQLDGTLKTDQSFFGTLSAPASGVSHTVELMWSHDAMDDARDDAWARGSEGSLRNQSGNVVIVIVISAAAVGALGCLLLSWLEECGGGCSEACGEAGVDSYSEGYCGTCECDCNPPLEI